MKVRISGNKLRLRLKQFEVAAFRETGMVTEKMLFGPEVQQQLQFVLKKGDNKFVIEQSGTLIQVYVPATVADRWTSTDDVGFEEAITTNHRSEIVLLVEKDFECVDGNKEDNVGAYPNPRMSESAS